MDFKKEMNKMKPKKLMKALRNKKKDVGQAMDKLSHPAVLYQNNVAMYHVLIACLETMKKHGIKSFRAKGPKGNWVTSNVDEEIKEVNQMFRTTTYGYKMEG